LTTAQPASHFSLGLAAYVQITSPIRRYGDLIAQRQLAAQAAGLPVMPAEALSELLEQVDHALRQGIQISREDQRHWQQVWFEAHHQDSFEGLFLRWLKPQDGLALVRLESLAMDLPVVVRESCEPGETVVARVRDVDAFADLLRLTGQRATGPRGQGPGTVAPAQLSHPQRARRETLSQGPHGLRQPISSTSGRSRALNQSCRAGSRVIRGQRPAPVLKL
jgi:hypothetical protein